MKPERRIQELEHALEMLLKDEWRMSADWGPYEDRQKILEYARHVLNKAPDLAISSAVRHKLEYERWVFIGNWCKTRGISPMIEENYNRAALAWAEANCPKSNNE